MHTEKADDEGYNAEFHYRAVGESRTPTSSIVRPELTPPDAIEAKLRNCDVFNLGSDALIDWQKQLREVTVSNAY